MGIPIGGVGKSNFARKHDCIYWYSKSDEKRNQWVFNTDTMRVPYTTKDTYWHNHEEGKLLRDIWEIPTINTLSKERTGYPTQKPLALLKRIISASSNEGDLILDPFCGCTTTCVTAQQLDRKWVGIDIEKPPVKILIDRSSDDAEAFSNLLKSPFIPETPSETNKKHIRSNKTIDSSDTSYNSLLHEGKVHERVAHKACRKLSTANPNQIRNGLLSFVNHAGNFFRVGTIPL